MSERFVKIDSNILAPFQETNVIIGNTVDWKQSHRYNNPTTKFFAYLAAADGASGYGNVLQSQGKPIGAWNFWEARRCDLLEPYVYARGKASNSDPTYGPSRILVDADLARKELRSFGSWAGLSGYHGLFLDNARIKIDYLYDLVKPAPREHRWNIGMAAQRIREGFNWASGKEARIVLNLSDPWNAWDSTGQKWITGDQAPIENANWFFNWNCEAYLELFDLRSGADLHLSALFVRRLTQLGGRVWLQLRNPGSQSSAKLLEAAGENVIIG